MKLGAITLFYLAILQPISVSAGTDTIKIGVLNDQSGVYADFGGRGSVEAAKIAVEEFGDTILGRKIEIISSDHQNKTDIGITTARKWLDVDGVDMITDLTNSAIAVGVQNLARERGKITIATGPGTTRLTNEDCSPTGFHWTWDTYSQSAGTARAVLELGGRDWFIISADYAFGHQMTADLTKAVKQNNGNIVGSVNHPLGTSDFSSYIIQAQGSKAKIVGLANAGADAINIIKQSAEFNIQSDGQTLVGLVVLISDVHALGQKIAQGLIATTAYYWDRDDRSREFAARFERRMARKPNMVQAGVYSAVLHYLKAVQAAGTDDGIVVAEKMKAIPVNDLTTTGAKIRADGRVVRDMYLVQVKAPEESKSAWDYYTILKEIPGEQAVIPLNASKCANLKVGEK